MISSYFGGISLFWTKFPYSEFQNFPIYILYVSLFGILDIPTSSQEILSLFNHSPFLDRDISLFGSSSVSHVCSSFNSRIDHYKSGDKTSIFKVEHEERLRQLQKLASHQHVNTINDIFMGAESRNNGLVDDS